MKHANQELLDKVNLASKWFPARKTKCLWAREVTQKQTVETLEGDLEASIGDYLCKGEFNDIWPQSKENLFAKYNATTETDNHGWQKFTPKPDAAGVFAICIDHPFKVNAAWGTLFGNPGDYLLKNAYDKNTDYPDDIWIVAKAIFEGTYEMDVLE